MKLSVGIATWNRADLLKQTLDSLTQVKVPAEVEWEVLVADNNSTDHTKSVVESMTSRIPVRYIFEEKQGLGFAHTAVNDAATGDWLLILDDDVLVDPNWIQAFINAVHKYPKATFFGGQVLPWLPKPVGGQARFLLEHFPWVHAAKIINADTRIDGSNDTHVHGPNMAFRRDILTQVGFDTQRGMIGTKRVGGEDTMLTLDFLKLGQEGWLLADYKVRHYTPPDRTGLGWFWRWHKQGLGLMMSLERGPAKPGTLGFLWIHRLIAKRFIQALFKFTVNRRRAYEILADAAAWSGYLQASKNAPQQPQ